VDFGRERAILFPIVPYRLPFSTPSISIQCRPPSPSVSCSQHTEVSLCIMLRCPMFLSRLSSRSVEAGIVQRTSFFFPSPLRQMESPAVTMSALPVELLFYLCDMMDMRSLVRWGATSRLHREIATHPYHWPVCVIISSGGARSRVLYFVPSHPHRRREFVVAGMRVSREPNPVAEAAPWSVGDKVVLPYRLHASRVDDLQRLSVRRLHGCVHEVPWAGMNGSSTDHRMRSDKWLHSVDACAAAACFWRSKAYQCPEPMMA